MTEKRSFLRNPFFLFAAIFAVLAACNAFVLGYPLYWDEMFGVHNQALFLAKNHFDVTLLFRPGETPSSGGSAVYHFGFVPYLYGLFYMILPSGAVHVLARLISIGCAAFSATLVLRLCEREGIPFGISLLGTASFLAFPVYSGQTASAGQELVMGALILWSLYEFRKGKHTAALILAFFACGVKLTAAVLPFAYFLWFAAFALFRKKYIPETVVSILLSILVFLPYRLVGSHIGVGMPENLMGNLLKTVIPQIHLFFPWLFGFFAVVAVLWVFSGRKKAEVNPRIWAFALFTGGFFAAYFLQTHMPRCPRYAVIAIMPAAFCAIYFLRGFPIRFQTLLFSGFLLVNLLNQHGLLLPPIPYLRSPDGSVYERSREYLDVVDLQREAVDWLEKNARNTQIAGMWPYTHILTVPEFGFVKTPFPYVLTGRVFPKITAARHLREYDPNRPILCIADFPSVPIYLPLPPENSRILKMFPIPDVDFAGILIYDYPELPELMMNFRRYGDPE